MPTQSEIDLTIYQRSRSLANFHLFSICTQIERIRAEVDGDDIFIMKPIADFEFLAVALVRFRRAASLASKVAKLKTVMDRAIAEFDAAIPDLKTLRDVAEHFDDYAVGEGRNKSLSADEFKSNLQVKSWSEDKFEWLGMTLDFNDSRHACEKLFAVIQTLQSGFPEYNNE